MKKCLICNADLQDETNEICPECLTSAKNQKEKYKIEWKMDLQDTAETDKKIGKICKSVNGSLYSNPHYTKTNIKKIQTNYYALSLIAEEIGSTKAKTIRNKMAKRKKEALQKAKDPNALIT